MTSSVRRVACVLAGVALGIGALADRPSAQQPGRPTLTVPDGFEIERVAGPPLVDRPITADFDDQGRLYVADSSGSNDTVEQQLAEAAAPHRAARRHRRRRRLRQAHRLRRQDDVPRRDDVARRLALRRRAAEHLEADRHRRRRRRRQREEWFQGKTLTGCANDLHGPYLGPDGWIYWCKGAFAEQTYERPGQKPLVTRGRPHLPAPARRHGHRAGDDRRHGQPGRRRLHARAASASSPTTFLQHPAAGKRDGLIHAIYGGVYGKDPRRHRRPPADRPDADARADAPRPRRAVAACTRYESAPASASRVPRQPLRRPVQHAEGHAPRPEAGRRDVHDRATATSSSPTTLDFHPTDVLEDADGSLLVVDTGGWYKLCCPTSQLASPTCSARSTACRRTDAPAVGRPARATLDWAKLTDEGAGPAARRSAAGRAPGAPRRRWSASVRIMPCRH